MAKITLQDGTVIEGTIEEFAQMGVKFPGGEDDVELKDERIIGIDWAKPKEEQPLGVGDYAKVINNHNTAPKFPIGSIIVITKIVNGGDYRYETLDGKQGGYVYAFRLVRATDEEVAEAKRKHSEQAEAERWAKIGRKPNEFKKGDAVRYKNAFTTVTGHTLFGIRINQSNHETSNIAVSPTELTLVFPVEAKFDGDDRP